jgi:hypothetical protein
MNTGQFIKEKMHNMAVWVKTELDIDCVKQIDARSELELTTLCAALHTHRGFEVTEDWDALLRKVEEVPLPAFRDIVHKVHERKDMHEKFWKYIKMFIEVIEGN